MNTVNDRGENFRDENGKLFLVRCYVCGGNAGRENYAMAVASGTCAFCGWNESNEKTEAILTSEK